MTNILTGDVPNLHGMTFATSNTYIITFLILSIKSCCNLTKDDNYYSIVLKTVYQYNFSSLIFWKIQDEHSCLK